MSETSRDHREDPSADGQTGDEIDTFPTAGQRSDHAGSSASLAGPAPGGDAGARDTGSPETRAQPHVPTGDATGAAGGYGTGSERSSGGSGEGRHDAGDDPETDWLREAPGTPSDR